MYINNALVGIASIFSPGFFPRSLKIIPSAPNTIGITVILIFRSFLNRLGRSKYLSLYSFSFIFALWLAGTANSASWFVLFILLINNRSDFLASISWSVYTSEYKRILWVSFSMTDSILCIYHLSAWPNLNLLNNSLWITFPTQSCLVLYSFCSSLQHLVGWLVGWFSGVSTLSGSFNAELNFKQFSLV